MSVEKFAVIGMGHFGRAIAGRLSKRGAEVMAIDNNQEVIDRISDDVAYAVCLDATDKKSLLAQDIAEFDAVVIAIGQNFEQRLLCATLLSDLGVKRIICRSLGKSQKIILERLGMKEILSPEDEIAGIVAERLLNPNLVSYLQLPDDHRIAEVKAPRRVVGRTLGDIDLRDRYAISLITIKRETLHGADHKQEHIIGVPDSKTELQESDSLMLFGRTQDIERFIEINQ